ncbi:hypothetical protein WG68_14005 [Arsukibacterium ikkense]|uniref:Copper resistance protein D n=1 Tax=Arsukibacterium ikkense TaxID=336831 RepID=A0A0M2V2Q4_9GAMM|nr:CopD family protein [Arsukibacterium ikkense]KKO44664.1 hypothetical protein WG68_14005 [Arsukibacterium ikkense]
MDLYLLLTWLAKVLLYLATTGVIGGYFIRWLSARDESILPWLGAYCIGSALLGVVSVVLAFGVQLLLFSGQGLASFYDWEMYLMLLDGNMGLSWGLAVAGFVSCWLAATFYWRGKCLPVLMLIVAACILLSYIFTGHLIRTPWYGQLALMLHLLGVSCWIGSLLPLWRISHIDNPELVARVMTDFGKAALIFVSLLLLMGVLMLQVLLGDVSLLWQTAYGLTLLAKLCLVLLLLGLGATNKLLLVPRVAMPGVIKRLRTVICIEMIAAALVLGLTAWATVVIGLTLS